MAFSVNVATHGLQWSIWRRYSEFLDLKCYLSGKLAIDLPTFPAKLRTSNLEPAAVEKRRASLEVWLQQVVAIERAKECSELTTFFDSAKQLQAGLFAAEDQVQMMQEKLVLSGKLVEYEHKIAEYENKVQSGHDKEATLKELAQQEVMRAQAVSNQNTQLQEQHKQMEQQQLEQQRQIARAEAEKKELEALVQRGKATVAWQWQDGSQWTPYDSQISAGIELKFEAFQQAPSNNSMSFALPNGTSYTISFDDMEQVNNGSNFKRNVRRAVTAVGIETPPMWCPMAEGETCRLDPVTTGSTEWDQVLARLHATLPRAKIVKLERIQNPALCASTQRNTATQLLFYRLSASD